MKKQYRIINKGKGVLKITPSNLNEVEQPLTEIEALYDYVNTRITLLDEAVDTRLSSLNENLITKIDDAVYDITEVVLPLKENKNEKGIANGYVPLNEFTKIALQYLNVVNNLVDGGTDALLTAEQGKQLQLQVSAIQNILFSDNVNLDTVQEIVDALENVQPYIDTILVNDLTTGGTTKALTAEMGKALKGLIDNLVTTKEDKTNKQNSLAADATNNKYPTVTAVNAALALKATNENVVHKTENETIFGIKTFKDDVIIDNKALKIIGVDSQGDSQEVSFGINSEGNIEWSVTDINTDKVTLNFNVNDGLNFNKKANFLGTVKAFPATLSNEVVVKSQLDAVVARPYKVYTAILTQTSTNNPTATVLENTLGGTITWVRYLDGRYRADLSYAGFILNKTIGFATPGGISLAASNQTIKVFVGTSASELIVYTIENGVLTDGILHKVPIEIRVYN